MHHYFGIALLGVVKPRRLYAITRIANKKEGSFKQFFHKETSRQIKEIEWVTGKNFEKELLTQEIMIPEIPYDFIVEELNHVKDAYDAIDR